MFEKRAAMDKSLMVGLLTKAERQAKLNHYRWKKARRSWNRKINYHSRKRVADTWPRFKGRFISVSQAGPLLEQYQQELAEKARKERIFAIQTFSRDRSQVLKTEYPNEESKHADFVPSLIFANDLSESASIS